MAEGEASDPIEYDYFSPEGMAQNTGSQRSAYQDMKPTEVHTSLKTLARSPEFRSAFNAESFARLFGSVSARNRHWVSSTPLAASCERPDDGCRISKKRKSCWIMLFR